MTLVEADLSGTDLRGAVLFDADHRRTTLRDANFEDTDLSEANLERARVTRTDFFGADLTRTNLYGAVIDNPQINSETEFGDHYGDALNDKEPDERAPPEESGPNVEVGADEPEAQDEALYDGKTHPRNKAIWTNRQVEQLALANALRDVARQAYIERKDLRRQQYKEDGDWARYVAAVLAGEFTGYLESPWKVVYTSLGVVGVWSAFYFLFGHIQLPDTPTRGDPVGLGLLPTLPLPDLAADALVSLYFSLVTFTNLGYGDLQPTGWAQGLATVESFVGALLMALLVFVLGRRTTW